MEKFFKKAIILYILFRVVTLAAGHYLFKVENGIYLINPHWKAECVKKTEGADPECVELKFIKTLK